MQPGLQGREAIAKLRKARFFYPSKLGKKMRQYNALPKKNANEAAPGTCRRTPFCGKFKP
jgi:hypothetical protein